jgi:hypothetical protein
MQIAYLERLAPDVRSLVEQIEQATGINIDVEVDSNRTTMACDIDKSGAQLSIPSPAYFPDDSVLHELLHIRRFFIEHVPRLIVCDDFDNWTPQLETAFAKLDNNIEHLVIVPAELTQRPARIAHWRTNTAHAINNIQDFLTDDRKRWALVTWLFIHHVLPEHDLIEQVLALTEHLGIRDHAARFAEVVIPSLASKERTVSACFEYLWLPQDAACLEYFDIQHRRSREIPLS